MTDKAKKKEEVKKEIRSLLLSAPLGLTISELKRDFVEFIGKQMPWKELGYNNAEDLVQDIPDTVNITWGNTGMVLTAVANKSTKHIEKLVQNQKVDSRKKKKVMERRSRAASHTMSARGWNNGVSNRYMGSAPHNNRWNMPPLMYRPQSQSQHYQRSRHLAALPCVPAYVRKQIHELVSQHADGLPLTHFTVIYRKRFGTVLDFNGMGFSTELDLLSSLRDIVGMRTLNGGETRVMSTHHCIAWDHNRWNNTGSFNKYEGNRVSPQNQTSLLPTPSFGESKFQSENVCVPKVGRGRGHGAQGNDISHNKNKFSDNKSLGLKNKNIQKVSPQRQLSNTDSGRGSPEVEQKCIPLAVEAELIKVMAKRPNGICASRLPFEYKDLFKKCLPLKTYGYNSVIEFASDLPHIIRIERPHPQGDWHFFPGEALTNGNVPELTESIQVKEQHDSTNSAPCVASSSHPPLEVDKSLKESVAQVLGIHPDGIPLEKFQQSYQAATGQALDVTKYGPGGLKRILHSMSDILIISLNASDRAVVMPKMQNGPRRFDQLQDQFQPIANSLDKTSEAVLHLPTDAVSPGCKYRPQPIPVSTEADGSNYIELYVSNVINPGMFWIQLRGRKTTLALEDLMDELEEVYSGKNLSKDYNMTPTLAQIGMVCAVIFPEDSFWHRGCITGFKDQLYQVYFVDYGNTCSVSIDQMRLLKSKFLKLPAQAILSRLGHIKPKDGVWKSNSRDRLLALAREKPLIGLIVGQKDRVLSLCLTDTSQAEDIHFNDVFVDEDYALFEPDSGAVHAQSMDQAPSSTFLYGAQSESHEPLSGQQLSGNDVQAEDRRYIRQAEMMEDITMNLINLHDRLYLTSGQISSLFFDQDIISAKLLRHDKADISKVVVDRKIYPDLFQELMLYDAPDVDKSTQQLTLFALDGLPLIIELFSQGDEHEEIKATALEILQWFDPEDPFWRNEDEDGTGAGELDDEDVKTQSSADDSVPSLEDLQLVLKTMQIKRSRILNRMMSESAGAEYVNELNTVELHIKRVEALISRPEIKSMECKNESNAHNFENNVQATKQNPLPFTSFSQSQTKTTHKVAPMVQQSPTLPQAPVSQVPSKPLSYGDSNPPPLMSAVDLSELLQEQLSMNQMLMQQIGLPTQNMTFPNQLAHGFGRGLVPTTGQIQMMQNGMLQASSLNNSNITRNPLQGSQLLSRDNATAISQLSMLGMPPTLSATLQPTSVTQSMPPGLSGLSTPLGMGRGQAQRQSAFTPIPQVPPSNSMFGISPQSNVGLHSLLQQQPNVMAFKGLQHQQHQNHQ